MTTPRPARLRCAVHPSRPAVDSCPVCERPRCGADARSVPAGCLACAGVVAGTEEPARAATELERLVRGALAAYAVALVGGVVASEYVGATVFSYVGPFVVGVVCAGAATRAAGTEPGPRAPASPLLASRVRVVGAVLAVLGVALGFLLEGSVEPLSAGLDVLVPYAAAVAGAVLWTMPPKRAAKSRRQPRATDV